MVVSRIFPTLMVIFMVAVGAMLISRALSQRAYELKQCTVVTASNMDACMKIAGR